MPGRNCRRMDNHLRTSWKNNQDPTDGSSRLARWANRLPAFTDLGTTDFFRIINGGTGTVRLRFLASLLPPWQRSRHPLSKRACVRARELKVSREIVSQLR